MSMIQLCIHVMDDVEAGVKISSIWEDNKHFVTEQSKSIGIWKWIISVTSNSIFVGYEYRDYF